MTGPSAPVEPRPFTVDLRGVVDLLSRHIYSGPRVYLRELLQNARDAITARAEADADWSASEARILITPAHDGEPLTITDNGVGLSAAEVAELLATVGRSSKRDIFDLPRSGYLGQFGIGLLSCFMVADEIVVTSRSARGGPAVRWTGRTDGTFGVTELDDDLPIGTTVTLVPRAESAELCGPRAVTDLAVEYAGYLPVPITIARPDGEDQITRPAVFADPSASPAQLLELGAELIGTTPFDVIPLEVKATQTRGVAYVLPYAPPPAVRQAHRVYLGRMLVSHRVDELLPDWAFFVRIVLDSDGLHPTASREDLVHDDALELTREALGARLRQWVLDLGTAAPHRLTAFLRIHQIALKAMALADDELARFIVRWLSVETTEGEMPLGTLLARDRTLRYAETIDEFRQLAGLVTDGPVIVNAGYLHDADLLRRLPALFDDVSVQRVDVVSEIEALSPPPLADTRAASGLAERAEQALTGTGCQVVVRRIASGPPAVYVADPEVFRVIDRQRARDVSGGLWSSVLSRVDRFTADERDRRGGGALVRLCLNWSDPLVRSLAAITDPVVGSRTVQLLYIQALLAGHHPLGAIERTMMSDALTGLVQLSLAGQDGTSGLPDHPRDPDPDRSEDDRS